MIIDDGSTDDTVKEIERFIKENTQAAEESPYINNIRAKLARIKDNTNLIYNLLDSNIAVTSGNFLFPRWLYEALGGFSDHRLVHDWNFILNASFLTNPVFVPQKLYRYRIHADNTFNRLKDIAREETDSILTTFLSRYKTNYTLMGADFCQQKFNSFIKRQGYGKYMA